MLVIHESCRKHFEATKKFARETGQAKQFAEKLNFLRGYGEHENGKPTVRVTLYKDFAPYSFSILWQRRVNDHEWAFWFNGGLIFHGPHDRGGDGGGPTFSVNLTGHYGWSVHT